MGIMKIKECKGYTKEEAFAKLNFNPNSAILPGSNATQAWNRAGRPMPGTMDFKRFASQQLEEKTHNQPGYGIHVVLDPPVRDIRKRPYTIINNKTGGTRTWKLMYMIREDELDVTWLKQQPEETEEGEVQEANWREYDEEEMEISVLDQGKVIDICEDKCEAIRKVKMLITETHKCYSILPMKIPDLTPIAAFGIYTPSLRAKRGTFIACGIEEEIEE